jgi:hypothetical protein
MAKHYKQTVEVTVANRIADLQSKKKDAIKEGDVERVEAIDKQIDKAKEAKADIPTKAEVAPEIETWVQANPWYKSDPEMHDFARAFNETYFMRHPNGDLSDSLKATTAAVKKAFPEKFKKPEDSGNGSGKDGDGEGKPKVRASSVEGGTAPAGKPKGYEMGRLTQEQRRVYEQHVKVHKILSHDEFFKGLEQIGELQ